MYLEISKPEYTVETATFTIVKVMNDNGSVAQVCTATAKSLDSTIMFLSEQFHITGIVDKRFI
jgi:hypothetical protein